MNQKNARNRLNSDIIIAQAPIYRLDVQMGTALLYITAMLSGSL